MLEIRSDDGARRQYQLHAVTRCLTLPRHPPQGADCTLTFPTARVGLRGRLVEDMNLGATPVDGNPALMLWFHGLTRIVAPIGSTRRPRRPAPVPVRVPERNAPWARRIIREPAVRELSRDWPEAWAARQKLLQLRAPAGERLPPG